MIVRNIKTTGSDRRYFSEKAKIKEAADAGKLGKSWLKKDRDGQYKLRPKSIINRV